MKRRNHNSPITDIFHYFIYYKIFEIIMSLGMLIIVYELFPKPFHFFFNIIKQALQ